MPRPLLTGERDAVPIIHKGVGGPQRWTRLVYKISIDSNKGISPPPPKCHQMSFVDFVVLPPGHGRSVTDFWGWDAHEAQLRCPDCVWVVIEEDVVPGGALNLNSTNLPRPWSHRESSPSRKIPMVEPGIEPGTSWLVDHEAGSLSKKLKI